VAVEFKDPRPASEEKMTGEKGEKISQRETILKQM
jgi:hypothetical protein